MRGIPWRLNILTGILSMSPELTDNPSAGVEGYGVGWGDCVGETKKENNI